jgi:phosphoribosyl 1,2-cyclic phosphodiesterase
MAVHLTILGSGSAGNATYIETDSTRLLVDAGFSARQIRQRLATLPRPREPESLDGILITHEHSDHTQGLAVLCAKLRLPIYCNRLTRDAIAAAAPGAPLEFRLFTTGATFEVGDVQVETFAVPHDAQDPVGFLLRTPAGNIGFLTDLGHATRLVVERVRSAHALVLEANYDLKLLQDDTRRPWSVKQRIVSRHGHLSNTDAADLAQQIVTPSLRHLYLAHLSRDCNRPDLALETVRSRLNAAGITHLQIEATTQDRPSPTLTLPTPSTPLHSALCTLHSALPTPP